MPGIDEDPEHGSDPLAVIPVKDRTATIIATARALSSGFNERPQEASLPFDRDRDGLVMGEDAGLLVIESLEHALAREAILAELKRWDN